MSSGLHSIKDDSAVFQCSELNYDFHRRRRQRGVADKME